MRCPECGQKARAEIALDAMTSERDRLREVLQLLYDTSDATPGTAQWEDYELAIHRAEQVLSTQHHAEQALKEVDND